MSCVFLGFSSSSSFPPGTPRPSFSQLLFSIWKLFICTPSDCCCGCTPISILISLVLISQPGGSCLVIANRESSLYFPTISTLFRINSHSQGGCDSATVSFLGLIAPSVFLLGLFERWQSASPPLQWRPRKKPPLFTFCYRVQSKKCHHIALDTAALLCTKHFTLDTELNIL